MPVLRDIPILLGVDEVLRAEGADPAVLRARQTSFVELAEQALREGLPLVRAAVLYRLFPVERCLHNRVLLSGNGVLSGPLVAKHLAMASRVAIVVCTIGPELEKQAAKVMASNPSYGLALDAVGSAAVEALAAAACRFLEVQAERDGFQATPLLSPGMVGWPVDEGQCEIARLVDAEEIGVTFLPTGMMVPIKSLSFVIGLGTEVISSGRPCDYCSVRERCRYKE
ncbi:MAG: hypothetical protein ACUVWZ_00410 [Anaerolineae bacterium]